ncbi:DUF1707 domain-containing protein [Streptomyces sp. G44]|uniref:DUF1707 domain-containing protein n=1 Tax=Streptomyces sp. G44 TaxID=2807632 RepID=UPI00195FCAFB|nr:DUF1707 domain-containing protein [Streptomyces sp. G44]MBM7169482.1 DUF1707 domain-containing protein [Streptomyces sp. G44]
MTTEPDGLEPARPARPAHPRQLAPAQRELDKAAGVLAEVYAAGLIGKEEFDQRLDAAFSSGTSAELALRMAALPAPASTEASPDGAGRRRRGDRRAASGNRDERRKRREHHVRGAASAERHRQGAALKALIAVILLAAVLHPHIGGQTLAAAGAVLLAYAVAHRRRHAHGRVRGQAPGNWQRG